MPSASDPRILILSPAVPQTWYAGSLLLYRLLQHYPPDRLKAVGPKPQPQSEILKCVYEELLPAASSRFDRTRLAGLKRSFETLEWVGRIPAERVDRAVGDFRADVIVSVMEQLDYVDAAHQYSRRHGVPLTLIVHDRIESFDRVYAPFKAAQRRRLAGVYRDAVARFCVSPEMERCLAVEYGAPGTVLYPSRSDALSPRPIDESLHLKASPRLTLGYAGAMNYGYGDRIAEVMPALAADGVELRLYSREAPKAAIPGLTYAGAFRDPLELWSTVKRECDAVWLPYSYRDDMRSLYETHFPSKLPEYLALGMPVLITGPDYATGVRWGVGHPAAALSVTDPSPGATLAAVVRLREDAGLRTQLAREAIASGNADFDPSVIRAVFFDTLRGVARPVVRS